MPFGTSWRNPEPQLSTSSKEREAFPGRFLRRVAPTSSGAALRGGPTPRAHKDNGYVSSWLGEEAMLVSPLLPVVGVQDFREVNVYLRFLVFTRASASVSLR